jgi:hypothetical protein
LSEGAAAWYVKSALPDTSASKNSNDGAKANDVSARYEYSDRLPHTLGFAVVTIAAVAIDQKLFLFTEKKAFPHGELQVYELPGPVEGIQ